MQTSCSFQEVHLSVWHSLLLGIVIVHFLTLLCDAVLVVWDADVAKCVSGPTSHARGSAFTKTSAG